MATMAQPDPQRFDQLVWLYKPAWGPYRAVVRHRGRPAAMEYALIRPARNGAGVPDSTTGEWLSIIATAWCKPGQTAFDMTATHTSLADAMLRIEGCAAMNGWTVVPYEATPR